MNVSIEYSMDQQIDLHDVRIHIPLGTYVYMYADIYMCVYMFMFIRIHICVYMYMYNHHHHRHIHTNVHIYIPIYMCVLHIPQERPKSPPYSTRTAHTNTTQQMESSSGKLISSINQILPEVSNLT
jgi:hypothetical protein